METIHSWALGLCAAAIIGSAAAVLTPSGSLEKSMKTIISVFLICAVILPFFKEKSAINNDLSKNFAECDEIEESVGKEVREQTESLLKSTVFDILERKGISCKDIVIQIETADNTVNVKSVTVIAPDKDAQTVKDILKSEAGIDADVVM